MSFGNRSPEAKRRRKPEPAQNEPENTGEEKEARFHPEFFGYLTAMLAIAATFTGLIIAAPHTYSAPEIRVKSTQITKGAELTKLSEEERDAFYEEHGVDFSRIMTPADKETTPAMQGIASKCAATAPRELVVNHIAAPRLYRQAKRYLICAMQTDRGRLCNAADRERLVEQLMAYRDVRQSIVAINGAMDELNAFARAYPSYQLPAYLNPSMGADGTMVASKTPMGDTINPRITSGLAVLVTNGYLSPSDFGYFGLYLPEEYVDVLTETPIVQHLCG